MPDKPDNFKGPFVAVSRLKASDGVKLVVDMDDGRVAEVLLTDEQLDALIHGMTELYNLNDLSRVKVHCKRFRE